MVAVFKKSLRSITLLPLAVMTPPLVQLVKIPK